jgi:aspartate carbamoyltransferase
MPLTSLTEDPATWKGASLLSVTQITPLGLQMLLAKSEEMKNLVRSTGGDNRLSHVVLGTVFFEASTRTSSSFQAAVLRLGGKMIHVDGQGNSSAGKKGESLEDTIRCLESYTDVTVLRHPVTGSVGKVIEIATKPVLNAGDGVGEHPTQALLDVFTIYDELKLSKNRRGLVVVLLGDLKHGRTVHSLANLLANSNVWDGKLTLRYCAPVGLEMPEYIKTFCAGFDCVEQEVYTDLNEACVGAHVLYVTRVQQERFDSVEEYEKAKVMRLLVCCTFVSSASRRF